MNPPQEAMRLAVMQPYFFPYLGYWQLIHSVDRFVALDDVNFIKQGWINRNRILVNGQPCYFTLPLDGASPNRHIRDIALHGKQFRPDKMLRSILLAYRTAPYFAEVFPVVEDIILHQADNLSAYLFNSISRMVDFLGIDTELVPSSSIHPKDGLTGEARVIDICRREGAGVYINPEGGQLLYTGSHFAREDISLRFLVMRMAPYAQRSEVFNPYLSIIDLLMMEGRDNTRHRLDHFDLLQG